MREIPLSSRSTNDPLIANIGAKNGIDVPWLRPENISNDAAPMVDVVLHAFNSLKKNYDVKAIVLLQPTSPLRRSSDISKAIKMFYETNADTVVSVTNLYEGCNENKIMFEMDSGYLSFEEDNNKISSQCFLRNGPAILVMDPDVVIGGSLYGERILGYQMPLKYSLDIDTNSDFEKAELALAKQKKTNVVSAE